MESLESQKLNAKRWMERQKVRLLAQVQEVAEERNFIANLVQAERYEYQQFVDAYGTMK